MSNYKIKPSSMEACLHAVIGCLILILCHTGTITAQNTGGALQVTIDSSNGNYGIGAPGLGSPVLQAGVAVQVSGQWLQSRSYPKHTVQKATVQDDLGTANEWTVSFSGSAGQPDLIYKLRAYTDKPFGDIRVIVRNGTGTPIHVESIRVIAASGNSIINLGGPASQDRVLSDSFSEDRPAITIHDLADAENGMHRGVGSQLVYNRQSHRSFFVGALTSDRFLTILRSHVSGSNDQAHIASYEVESTGTTELEKQNSLREAPAENQIQLNLPVAAGSELRSERLIFGVGKDYHRQLETYGSLIRKLHHARVEAPTPMGWWSWTAYYFGLNEGAALTNAQWLAQNLKALGYDFFHIDEGYQYARGEYSTPNAALFPHGMANLEGKVQDLGLVPGIWTAPFEVSERSWVYEHHPDWLVHNAKGEPIHAGWVTHNKDRLFILDVTNPGAQGYLRKTYSTLVHKWGIRYIKMDFMDDSAIEGYYYRPNTTAMEAQRIGLGIIRKTVGDKVLLDKDGSVMLNPVGYVDFGRISQDTGHTFQATKDAASGMAARYYMNRNFFVADPDAFSVSKQTVGDQSWHGGSHPLTLDEAKASIALSAVSGGMYEIGDDLPTLGSDPERLALVQNKDLIAMVRLGKASLPIDLMTYLPEDQQPSTFFLKEDRRQGILTIFNWTDTSRTHRITLSSLGLAEDDNYNISDVFSNKEIVLESKTIVVNQPLHSARVFKIIDTSIPAQTPNVRAEHPSQSKAGETATFKAGISNPDTAVVSYQWDCGDGVKLEGKRINHTYTHSGQYKVTLTVVSVEGKTGTYSFVLPVTGTVSTRFVPAENRRYEEPN